MVLRGDGLCLCPGFGWFRGRLGGTRAWLRCCALSRRRGVTGRRPDRSVVARRWIVVVGSLLARRRSVL